MPFVYSFFLDVSLLLLETFQEREDEQNKKESSVRVVYSSLPRLE